MVSVEARVHAIGDAYAGPTSEIVKKEVFSYTDYYDCVIFDGRYCYKYILSKKNLLSGMQQGSFTRFI